MKAFRFRAAGALALRRRQEDEARLAFARADAARRAVEQRLHAAEAAMEQGSERLRELHTGSHPSWLLGWHRSWMTKQRLELDASRRDVAVATAAAATATAALRLAYRRRRVLERWRERAWQQYLVEARRHDAREMDQLAGLRYAAQAAEREGATNEHDRRH
jgi:flagellar FliJ protein